MNEVDDRLFGDPVWELFADPNPDSTTVLHPRRYWLIVAGAVVALWFFSPALAVLTACFSVAFPDFRRGRLLARSIPVKAGGSVCSSFAYAWGCWKIGISAFLSMFVTIVLSLPPGKKPEIPVGSLISLELSIVGFFSAAATTSLGLLSAYRSGMQIWIGEGVNRARILILETLIVAFLFFVIIPVCAWFVGLGKDDNSIRIVGCVVILLLSGGSVLVLFVLDRISRHVVAKRPGKFGPKVSAVGKWNS